ncbi:MAG: prolyl-tRNA synthetase associated domain-containing protein [Lachnospiraceae bacterium]|nr:prolyl-tRNA synthetase associated domain-containing protein [Lachnospiraceae bacterium]
MELSLVKGRPESVEGRLATEVAVYDLLDSLGITYERVDHEPAFTMEACLAIDRVLAPAVICKNLFLCNAQRTKFYLLMIREDKKFKTKEITKQIGSSRLSFAPEEAMEQYLKITPGSVSVMGLMNDAGNDVQLVIDEDVLKEELFGCHPCINTSSIRISVADLVEKFLPAVHHDYLTVVLGNGLE